MRNVLPLALAQYCPSFLLSVIIVVLTCLHYTVYMAYCARSFIYSITVNCKVKINKPGLRVTTYNNLMKAILVNSKGVRSVSFTTTMR